MGSKRVEHYLVPEQLQQKINYKNLIRTHQSTFISILLDYKEKSVLDALLYPFFFLIKTKTELRHFDGHPTHTVGPEGGNPA